MRRETKAANLRVCLAETFVGSLRTVAVLLPMLLLLAIPLPAWAFQFYFFFAGPSSSGEGGGRYFTGSPRYKFFNCRICQVHTPGEIRVSLRTEPEDLFRQGYQPGVTYEGQLTLDRDLRAPGVKLFSTNNFCFEVLDTSGRNVGTLDTGFPGTPLSQLLEPVVLSPDSTVVMSGPFFPDLSWSWFWVAPPPGTGPVTFYLGFVDGNGDLKAFTDDVSVLQREIFERP